MNSLVRGGVVWGGGGGGGGGHILFCCSQSVHILCNVITVIRACFVSFKNHYTNIEIYNLSACQSHTSRHGQYYNFTF